MATDGLITRKEIIEDEALNWGKVYEENIQTAIKSNKVLVESVKELNIQVGKFKTANSNKDYISAKQAESLATQQAILAIKEQEAAEISANKIKISLISTIEAERKAKVASEISEVRLLKAKKESVKLSLEEKIALGESNRNATLLAKSKGALVSAYERLNAQRLISQKRLADLLSAEKQNTSQIKTAQLEYDKLDARVKAVDAATKNYSKNIGNYSSAFQGLNQTARSLISTFGLLTGVALFGQIVKDIFSTIKDFDRQLIAVGKTTNITGDDLKNFGAEVVDLGDKLNGVSVEGLLKSAEVAGQLGVKGTENILRFSTAIEKLKLTSDIISNEQVQDFAKFIEVSKDSFENADRLASVITQLGNNFATTEAQVLENATEIQKGISIYEASAESVLGLGAATSSLGSEAESSRSAIMTTFKVIDKAISTGANLEKVLKLTGLTEKELSTQFNKDATGVFVKFVGGLKNAKDEGKNLNNILDAVGITEKRATTVIGALSANYDLLANSVATATLEYQENAALNKEVEAASKSISSILGDVKDKWAAYILTTDQANGGTQKIAKTLRYVADNLESIIDNFIKYGSVLLAYLGIMKLVNFVILTARAAELAFALATGIGRTAVLAKAAAVRAATVAQIGLNTAMAASPWGIIIGLIAAAVVAYKVFGNQLSDTEKVQNRINANISKKKKELDAEAKTREELFNKNIKQIEDEYELKGKKQGESKKLDAEEIEAKKKLLQTEIDKNTKTINLNREAIEDARKTSKEKIKILEEEALAEFILASKSKSEGGTIISSKRYGKKISDLTVSTTKEVDDLRLTNKALYDENKKYEESKKELKKKSTLIITEEERELSEKARTAFLEAQKKLRKELYDAEKKANDDLFKLSQFRLQKDIDINNEIVNNEKYSLDEKLDALETSNKKMLQKNKEGLENELSQLGKYNEDSGKFVRQLSDVEIAEFIKTGELKKTLTAEQQLLYEKYQVALTAIATDEEKKRQAVIDGELNAIQKRIDAELQLKENDLNGEIVKENGQYASELDAAKGNYDLIEKARIDHENRMIAIQKKSALDMLNLQINNTQKILDEQKAKPEGERISAELIKGYTADLARFQMEASGLVTDNHASNLFTKAEKEKEFKEKVIDLSFQIKDAMVGLTNAIFDARIQKIDEDIQKSEDYYNRQLELAGDDQIQKDLITNQAEKEREKLEAKKRKEQQKQAIFNKAVAIAEIAIQTALGIMKASPVIPLMVLTGILGAIQLATAIATPIPKYEKGTKNAPEGWAITGEKRHEVITDKFGNNPRLTPNTPTLTYLNKGDQVHSSIDDYYRLQRAAMMSSIAMEGRKTSDFQAKQSFDDAYGKERLGLMKETLKAVKSQKTIILKNKIDIPHSIWKSKNINWN